MIVARCEPYHVARFACMQGDSPNPCACPTKRMISATASGQNQHTTPQQPRRDGPDVSPSTVGYGKLKVRSRSSRTSFTSDRSPSRRFNYSTVQPHLPILREIPAVSLPQSPMASRLLGLPMLPKSSVQKPANPCPCFRQNTEKKPKIAKRSTLAEKWYHATQEQLGAEKIRGTRSSRSSCKSEIPPQVG